MLQLRYNNLMSVHRQYTRLYCLRLSAGHALILLFVICIFSPAQAKNGGWDLEPYHVQISIAIDVPGGLAEQLVKDLPRYIDRRVEASLTPAWSCGVQVATDLERAKVFSTI